MIDSTKLAGQDIVPLADYISMLALTQINSLDACQDLPSVVNRLAPDCGQPADSLTMYDLAYLQGLYHMTTGRGGSGYFANMVLQWNEIGDMMTDRLEKLRVSPRPNESQMRTVSAFVAFRPADGGRRARIGRDTVRKRHRHGDQVARSVRQIHQAPSPRRQRCTGKIARWERRICPLVVGQNPHFTTFITQRIKYVALAAGAPVDTEASCTPNIEIVFTTTPQALLDNVRKTDPRLSGLCHIPRPGRRTGDGHPAHPGLVHHRDHGRERPRLVDSGQPGSKASRSSVIHPSMCKGYAVERQPHQ